MLEALIWEAALLAVSLKRTAGMAYVSLVPAVQMAHVRDVDLERALDLLVLRENGLDRVVVILHLTVNEMLVLRRKTGADR